MTDTNSRNLTQRLTMKLDPLNRRYNVPNQSALIDEAYAYLSQPEPEGPPEAAEPEGVGYKTNYQTVHQSPQRPRIWSILERWKRTRL